MFIQIVYQDEWIVAANKPSGLPVHATVDPLRPNLQGLLEKQLETKLVLHHRLDLDTTGVVLFSKNNAFNKEFTDIFRDRLAKKTYWAVVEGRWLHEWKVVDTFIDKAPGGRWANVKKGGKDAQTLFKVLSTNGEKTWIEAKPQTGRTHQIRLHCLFNNHPICGDRDYGKKHPQGVPIALHAKTLEFPHPGTGKEIKIEAEAPDYWKTIWLKDLNK